jgi:hypothetical protein
MAQYGAFEFGASEFGASTSRADSFAVAITLGASFDGTRTPANAVAVRIAFGASFAGVVVNTANARITQVAREVLQQGGNPNARITQVAREVLVRLDIIAAAEIRFGASFAATVVRSTHQEGSFAAGIAFGVRWLTPLDGVNVECVTGSGIAGDGITLIRINRIY